MLVRHQGIKHSDIYQSGFVTGRDSFTVIRESDDPLNTPLNKRECLFEVFVHRELYRVALKLLILLGPHNAVLFSDWGKHNRIRPYNVGGFVCQEQEANYVDMLLLTRGCTFIAHTLQQQWKPLTNPLFFRLQQRQRQGKFCHFEVLNAYKKEIGEKDLAHAQLSTSFFFSASLPVCLSFPPSLPLSVSPDSCHSLHTMDQDYYEGTDYLSPVPADGERTEEFEYEVGIALDITA